MKENIKRWKKFLPLCRVDGTVSKWTHPFQNALTIWDKSSKPRMFSNDHYQTVQFTAKVTPCKWTPSQYQTWTSQNGNLNHKFLIETSLPNQILPIIFWSQQVYQQYSHRTLQTFLFGLFRKKCESTSPMYIFCHSDFFCTITNENQNNSSSSFSFSNISTIVKHSAATRTLQNNTLERRLILESHNSWNMCKQSGFPSQHLLQLLYPLPSKSKVEEVSINKVTN